MCAHRAAFPATTSPTVWGWRSVVSLVSGAPGHTHRQVQRSFDYRASTVLTRPGQMSEQFPSSSRRPSVKGAVGPLVFDGHVSPQDSTESGNSGSSVNPRHKFSPSDSPGVPFITVFLRLFRELTRGYGDSSEGVAQGLSPCLSVDL